MKRKSKVSQKPKVTTLPKPSISKSPDPTVINLGGGRTARINMHDADGNPLPQLLVSDVPISSVDLIAVKLEELGYKLAGSQPSQKFDLGFQRV